MGNNYSLSLDQTLNDEEYRRYMEFRKYGLRLAKTLYTKNKDYGNAIAETGLAGCQIRLYDKMKRLKNIIENGENAVEGEPLEDAFWDTAGYSILWKMIKDKSSVFFDERGNIIERNNGSKKEKLLWLRTTKKMIEQLIRDERNNNKGV